MKKFEGYTMQQGKDFLRENWNEGVRCPCCDKHVQLYRTRLNSAMARALIIIYKAPASAYTADGWLHVEDYFVEIGVTLKGIHGKLKHWRLLEQKHNDDEPNKNKNGLWRITELGRDFVEAKVAVHRAVYLYLDKVRHRDESPVSIYDALSEHFDYEKLMNGEFYETEIDDLPPMLKRQSGAQ